MKKLALFPAALVGCMGFAFAYISIFPISDPQFPQFPVGAGTIGGVLSGSFSSTGLARDSDALGGVAASGYLQNTNCTNLVNNVWVGVDENGKGKCGSLNSDLLGYITDYTGSNLRVYSGTTWYPVNSIPFDIYVGNFVETTGATLATVTFSDDSLIRLNTDSKVDFTLGDNGSGATVAQVILDHGEIWGRVLTSTGINFGNSDWIAGVRGTAITMDYRQIEIDGKNVWTGSIDIIDSTNSGTVVPAAVVVSQHNPLVKTNLFVNQTIAMVKPSELPNNSIKNNTDFSDTNLASQDLGNEIDSFSKANTLVKPWVRENMKKDLIHLANLENSGGISAPLKARVEAEFLASIPKTLPECSNIVTGKIVKHEKSGKAAHKWSKKNKSISTTTDIVSSDYCNPILNSVTLPEKINKTGCALQSMTYFGSTDPENICEKQGIVARAEYTRVSGNLEGSLGMFTLNKTNLFDDQGTLAGAKFIPKVKNYPSDLSFNDLSACPNTPPFPPSCIKSDTIQLHTDTSYWFGDTSVGYAIMSKLGVSGVYLDNYNSDTFLKYKLPINVNKIEISVRGAGLMRRDNAPYYLFGIPGGFNLKVKEQTLTLSNKSVHKIDLNLSGMFIDQNEYYTIVFKKDTGTNEMGILSIETSTGQTIGSDNKNVGTTEQYFKGSSPYLYVGTDGSHEHAFNDIIDSVRLYDK